jgi:endogenous inhibitor of DNA gyrase (YacG/DUF329 family)
MQKTCVICNNSFEAKRKDALYCSAKCKKTSEYLRQEKLVKNCEHCGQTFETKRKETKYCSSSCSNTACKTHDDVTLSCKECGTDFVRKYIHRDKLFCSRSCATVHQNKIIFSDDKIKNKISETKKRQYETGEVVHPFLGKNLTEEHKQKLSDIKIKEGKWKGENNPAYGGQSKEIREKMSKTRAERIQSGEIHGRLMGTIVTTKGGTIKYRSNWEKNHIENLEKDEKVISYIFEPFVLEYTYDQTRNYIPDILIFYKDGTKKLVEIKPSYFLDAEINKCKFSAAQKYCDEKGMTFEVWTEKNNPYSV